MWIDGDGEVYSHQTMHFTDNSIMVADLEAADMHEVQVRDLFFGMWWWRSERTP